MEPRKQHTHKNQTTNTITKTRQDLDRVVKAAKKGVEKAKREQLVQDEEEKRKVMSDAESAALKLIQHKKNTAMFLFDSG